MTIVTNDYATVLKRSGFDSWYHCLPPKLGIDQFKTVLPVMVARDGGEPVIVAKEIDRTNLEIIDSPRVRFVFHTPYFTFDRAGSPTDAAPDLPSAIAAVAGADARLDPRLPVGLYGELAERLQLRRLDRPPFVPPLNCYRVPVSVAQTAPRPYRLAALAGARQYLEELGSAKEAEPWLSAPAGDAFSVLDKLLRTAGVDAIIASTPLNVQELSGIPASLVSAGTWAVYQRGTGEVFVLACRELPWLGLPESKPLGHDPAAALASGTVGYEELDLAMEAFEGLGVAGLPARPTSLLFRRWREMRSFEDLAFYTLGAQVTVRAIGAALSVVRDAVARGDAVTELDAYERYRAVVADEIERRELPIRVRTYFTHVHGGNRSLIPARATGHSLLPLTSLKIDAGLEVYDPGGSLRAVSDVTRSAVESPDAVDAYRLLDRVLAEDVISACRPGTTGEAIFLAGTRALDPHHTELAGKGLSPAGSESYAELLGRDIGHLLGKQEPATVVFQRGNAEPLEPGMVAAAEIQWPYHDHCIGVEDVFMTTEAEPLNLTRGPRQSWV